MSEANLKLCALRGCRKAVNPDVDHEGRPHGGVRTRYCSVDHRYLARLDRRADARAASSGVRRDYRRKYGELLKLAKAEARGELAPLPGMAPAAELLPPMPAVAGTPSG